MTEIISTSVTQIVRRHIDAQQDQLPQDLHPVLRRILLARHVTTPEQLERSLSALLPFHNLHGIDQAAELLGEAIRHQRRILIVADFDADGATSCAVALRALKMLGAQHVDFIVPNRFEYGYGLTPEIVALAVQKKPDLIVTVDNGISSNEGVAAARAQGIDVLVTDHHLPGQHLPEANAIVNPNQPACHFASKHIAGVGVIFYVMLAVRAWLRERQWFAQQSIPEPVLASVLDLVATGTVADVVTLDHNNRILVSQGIARIRAKQACPGILALLEVAGRDPSQLQASDLGFCIGPRLNAAGRLEDMSIGIACLLAEDIQSARELARRLDQLNRERREIESDMKEEAWQHVQLTLSEKNNSDLPVGMCLYDPNWHEGVIGIVAGRIKELLHRPVIVFAQSRTGVLKGSARSIPGLHIRDALDAVAASHPQLLQKFGGHAMAAGLTLAEENFKMFCEVFDSVVRQHVDNEALQRVFISDGELSQADMTLDLARLIRQSGPWGQGFPEPRFDGVFDIVTARIVGERHVKLVLRSVAGQRSFDAIAFNPPDPQDMLTPRRVHLYYRLDINDYLGTTSLQLVVEHIQELV